MVSDYQWLTLRVRASTHAHIVRMVRETIIWTGFLCVRNAITSTPHAISHDKFTCTHVLFRLVEEVMATGSACHIDCCLCEAVVGARERGSVATTINFLKDTVVDIYEEDVAIFNRDSKLCRRSHKKFVARYSKVESRSRCEDEKAEEADRESGRACWRATAAASRSSVFPQAIHRSLSGNQASLRRITSLLLLSYSRKPLRSDSIVPLFYCATWSTLQVALHVSDREQLRHVSVVPNQQPCDVGITSRRLGCIRFFFVVMRLAAYTTFISLARRTPFFLRGFTRTRMLMDAVRKRSAPVRSALRRSAPMGHRRRD